MSTLFIGLRIPNTDIPIAAFGSLSTLIEYNDQTKLHIDADCLVHLHKIYEYCTKYMDTPTRILVGDFVNVTPDMVEDIYLCYASYLFKDMAEEEKTMYIMQTPQLMSMITRAQTLGKCTIYL